MSFPSRSKLLERCLCTFALCLLLVAGASTAFAQAVSGTFLGAVTDPSGAAVAGAKVTFTHKATGLTRSVVSDDSGEYIAPSLPVGAYNITVEMAGFSKLALSDVQLG